MLRVVRLGVRMRKSEVCEALFTLYIYIKVLFILACNVGSDAGVPASIRHLSLLYLNYSTTRCYSDAPICLKDLKRYRKTPERQVVDMQFSNY